MNEENEFQELIRRVRSGDSQAAAELVRQYEPTIRRVARVRLVDPRLRRRFDSLDICQSVFGSFFVRAALGQFDLATPEQLLGLLVRMSQKKVADGARQARAARRDVRRTQGRMLDAGRLRARDPSPSEEVATKELLVEFRRRMSEDERQLADQRAAGLNWDQIAGAGGESSEALRKKLARAIDRVSKELGMGEDGP
jgi:RNA polymerase sigma factor (sigma-70 family)